MGREVSRLWLRAAIGATLWMSQWTGSAQGLPVIETVTGNGGSGFSGDNGPAPGGTLKSSAGVAVDGAGNLFIADSANNRIRRVDVRTGIITTVAGNGEDHYNSMDGVLATKTGLEATAVAADTAGNLFIASQYSNRIRRVDAQTKIITTYAGSGTTGYSGDGFDATSASLHYPNGVALDGAGNLFIADTYNNCIRRVDAATRIITTVAGNGSAGDAGDGGPATSANLDEPLAVAVDGAGNLFIADESNYRVRHVDARTKIITTMAGKGGSGYPSENGVPATSTGVDPWGVAVDSAGNVFIAEARNDSIRRVDPQTGVILRVAGNGVRGYSGDGGPATSASLNTPKGLAADGAGNLYIADTGNNRIRRVVVSTGPRLVISQAALSFTAAGSQTISVTSSGAALSFAATASTISGANWLSVSPSAATTPASVSISVDPGALSPGSYTGTVAIASAGAGNSPQNIGVSLTVAPAAGLTINSISLPVAVVGLPYGPVQFSATGASGTTTWSQTDLPFSTGLSLSAAGVLSGTPAAGHEGLYAFTVLASNTGMIATGRFTLTIRGVATVATLNYQLAKSGGGTLSSQRAFHIQNDTSGSAVVQVMPNVPWITVSASQINLADASSSQPVSVQIDRTQLPADSSYASGAITLLGLSTPKEVRVNVALQDRRGLPLLSRSAMTFYVQQRQLLATDENNLVQTVAIINDGPDPIKWSVETSRSFVSVNPSFSTTNLLPGKTAEVEVSVSDRDLMAGTHPAKLSFLFDEVSLTEFPVSVVVSTDPLPSELFLDKTGVILKNGEEQDITIYNYTTQDYSIVAAPASIWIKVSPNGTTLQRRGKALLHVSVDAPPDMHSGLERGLIPVDFVDSSRQKVASQQLEVLFFGSDSASAASAGFAGFTPAGPGAAQCVPGALRAVFTTVSEGATVAAGLPGQIDVKISDNCGNAIKTGAAAVSFSNGDPPVPLLPDGTGSWQGTWVPGAGREALLFMGAVSGEGHAFGTAVRSVQLDASALSLPIVPTGAVVNAASLIPAVDRIAPGTIISISGDQLASETASAGSVLSYTLGSSRVRLGQAALPLIHVSPTRIIAFVPPDAQPEPSTSLVVERSGFESVPLPVVSLPTDPGIFKGGLVSAATGQTVSPEAPAQRGDGIAIYCTGLGPVSESLDPTLPAPSDHFVYSKPVAVFIQGASGQWISSHVSSAGLAQGYFGLYQVKAEIPNDAATGDQVELYMGLPPRLRQTVKTQFAVR